jgi:hypothetical protein
MFYACVHVLTVIAHTNILKYYKHSKIRNFLNLELPHMIDFFFKPITKNFMKHNLWNTNDLEKGYPNVFDMIEPWSKILYTCVSIFLFKYCYHLCPNRFLKSESLIPVS